MRNSFFFYSRKKSVVDLLKGLPEAYLGFTSFTETLFKLLPISD